MDPLNTPEVSTRFSQRQYRYGHFACASSIYYTSCAARIGEIKGELLQAAAYQHSSRHAPRSLSSTGQQDLLQLSRGNPGSQYLQWLWAVSRGSSTNTSTNAEPTLSSTSGQQAPTSAQPPTQPLSIHCLLPYMERTDHPVWGA